MTTAHASAEEVANRAKSAGELAASSIVAKAENEATEVLKTAALKAEQLRAQIQRSGSRDC